MTEYCMIFVDGFPTLVEKRTFVHKILRAANKNPEEYSLYYSGAGRVLRLKPLIVVDGLNFRTVLKGKA